VKKFLVADLMHSKQVFLPYDESFSLQDIVNKQALSDELG